ncbi:MAG: peptidoglycan DD-metalloendopeptidase family protein [Pseudomonadota bacterium]
MAYICLGLWAHSMAFAQNTEEEAARLQEIEAQLRANAAAAAALRSKDEEAAAAMASLQARLVEIADSLQLAEANATQIEETLARLNVQEATASVNLEERQKSMSQVLAALQSLERARPPALAVSPDDVTDAAVAAIALTSVTPDLKAEAAALRADLARMADLRARQAAKKLELRQTEATLNERSRLLQDLLRQRRAAKAEDEARLQQLAAEDQRLAAEASDLRELIAGLKRRAEARAARPAPTPPSLSSPTLTPRLYGTLPSKFSQATALLPVPVIGRIAVPFGTRLEGGARTEDMTFVTRAGAVVISPFSGEVVWAEPFGRLGNVVILDVGEGYRIVLMGLGQLDVRRDERVRAGEPVGSMDGNASGALRLQIRKNNAPIDPMAWLRVNDQAKLP